MNNLEMVNELRKKPIREEFKDEKNKVIRIVETNIIDDEHYNQVEKFNINGL